MKTKCLFCDKKFPLDYSIISNKFKYWLFVYNINPICDFHCLIVLKKEYSKLGGKHINSIECNISEDILSELWIILNKASIAIKKSNKNIKQIDILSLNSWENSKHLHFHLIPIFKDEELKKINNFNMDWWWIFFLWRKEIVQDTIDEHIKQTCWDKYLKLLEDINLIKKKQILKNVTILKKNFNI
jgi:diadenosine tetraphosphate (Ap4A) HIT family hydrolase